MKFLKTYRIQAMIFLGLLALSLGHLRLQQNHGLQAFYYPNAKAQGKPLLSRLDKTPYLRGDDGYKLLSTNTFSVKWLGWISIENKGKYIFATSSDDGSSLRINGEMIVDNGGPHGRRKVQQSVTLDKGVYPIEILYSQFGGASVMEAFWMPPVQGSIEASLPEEVLFSKQPGFLEIRYRRIAPIVYGILHLCWITVFLYTGCLFLSYIQQAEVYRRLENSRWRTVSHIVYFLVLFGAVFWGIYRFTGGPAGGDDAIYLDLAMFTRAYPNRLNRYVHIYLLKAFFWLSGDPFIGTRLCWSFTFSGTIVGLALAIKSLGTKLQIRTFALTLMLLFGQKVFFYWIGVGLADYTAAMFITVALAVYMQSLVGKPEHRRWYAFAIGMLAVLATKSKDVGIIVGWFLLLFVFENGRLQVKKFGKMLAYGIIGALLVFLIVMIFDAIIIDDFFFSVRPSSFERLADHNFDHPGPRSRTASSWLDLIWGTTSSRMDSSLRIPALLIILTTTLLTYKKKALELRLMQLTPALYILMLLVAHIRGTFYLNPRHLLAIIPISCCLAGTFFHYIGIDDISLQELLSSKFAIPLMGGGVFILYATIAYQSGNLQLKDFLPLVTLQHLGWPPEFFLTSIVIPLCTLLLLTSLALFFRHHLARTLVLLILFFVMFGASFSAGMIRLPARPTFQKGEDILYPLRAFEHDILITEETRIVISPNLTKKNKMFSPYKGIDFLLIGVFFKQQIPRKNVAYSKDLSAYPNWDYAFGTAEDYMGWKEANPALESTAKTEPKGQVVLVSPKAASQ